MPSIFKRVRKKILGEGAARRYVLYAGGEILLVVIGILLALQINNWNEERKERAHEKYVLGEILLNLEEDRRQVAFSLDNRQAAAKAIQKLSSANQNEYDRGEYEQDLAGLFSFERFYPIKTGYGMIISTGLTVSDQELRTKLGQYYEYDIFRVQAAIKDIEDVFLSEFHDIVRKGYFRSMDMGQRLTLHKYPNPELATDIEKYIVFFKENNRGSIGWLERFLVKNNELQEHIARARAEL